MIPNVTQTTYVFPGGCHCRLAQQCSLVPVRLHIGIEPFGPANVLDLRAYFRGRMKIVGNPQSGITANSFDSFLRGASCRLGGSLSFLFLRWKKRKKSMKGTKAHEVEGNSPSSASQYLKRFGSAFVLCLRSFSRRMKTGERSPSGIKADSLESLLRAASCTFVAYSLISSSAGRREKNPRRTRMHTKLRRIVLQAVVKTLSLSDPQTSWPDW